MLNVSNKQKKARKSWEEKVKTKKKRLKWKR